MCLINLYMCRYCFSYSNYLTNIDDEVPCHKGGLLCVFDFITLGHTKRVSRYTNQQK